MVVMWNDKRGGQTLQIIIFCLGNWNWPAWFYPHSTLWHWI